MQLSSVPELIEDIKAGKLVILVDDENRENEGDLVCAAEYITPQMVNFMVCEARGLVCLALTAEQIDRLKLPLMVGEERNSSPNRTAFTVSIEAAEGVSTGISAADRALTIKVASRPSAKPSDVITPGHIFPIRAQNGGVLRRAGHTEASVDLMNLAGLNPAAVICEVMNADGSMARMPDLISFAEKHKIKVGTIESLIQYRIQTESLVEAVASSRLPSQYGEGFHVHVFRNRLDGREHLAIVKGKINPQSPTLVRVHTECLVGDVFASLRHPTGETLKAALKQIDQEGQGVLVYLRLEEMGGRLVDLIKRDQEMDSSGPSTSSTSHSPKRDERDYGVGAQILRALGVRRLRLMTHAPAKKVGLKGYGLEIVETLPLPADPHPAALEGADFHEEPYYEH